MNADPVGVLTGAHFIDGDHACCEGAIAAGCRFVAGYPITPSTEVVERIAERFPRVGGVFIQMEDEIASSIAIQGAVWAGKKAMTVTSGPGFSLMMEHVGFAAMTETPCVFVNVQRAGPSTGLPTQPAQGDMMQARWGSHGDYQAIAICPNSPQECFDLTIKAFNLSEQYRVPVFLMMDECVGHMTERVLIPPADQIHLVPRRWFTGAPETYEPFRAGPDMVPQMVKAGDGFHIHVTGLTHDERGYPNMSVLAQEKLVQRLHDKITKQTAAMADYVEDQVEGADIVVVTYGITSRTALPAIERARKEGLKVGHLRLIVVWPFPEHRIRELASRISAFVVPELNMGQIVLEVERCSAGKVPATLVGHTGGTVHQPDQIYQGIVNSRKGR
ncbi:MAG: 2-oxoglutarate ferredoxin oxidoreductase, alpha subunit [Bacteroidetes bacterium]|nr:2-oxoglutarate ferredoxin oxidoreductase, alpha subunit [Bacteroidota bacterium]